MTASLSARYASGCHHPQRSNCAWIRVSGSICPVSLVMPCPAVLHAHRVPESAGGCRRDASARHGGRVFSARVCGWCLTGMCLCAPVLFLPRAHESQGGVRTRPAQAETTGESSQEVRPWEHRLRDASMALKGREIVVDTRRQFRRMARSSSGGAGGAMDRLIGRSQGGTASSEACGLAAQKLRQAAEQYAKAGQCDMAGRALETKARLHEMQQLPDAQVSAAAGQGL